MDAKQIQIPATITDAGTRRLISQLLATIAELQEEVAKLKSN